MWKKGTYIDWVILFDVYKNGQAKTFNISEFLENNEIKYIKGELPKFERRINEDNL